MMLSLSSRPSSRWRRMTIVLIAVPTVLVALLAMHFLLSESPAPESHALSASAASLSALAVDSPMLAVAQKDSAVPDTCVETCGPTHDVLTMACVLVLLASALLILFHYSRFQFRIPSTVLQVEFQRVFALVPAPQPSLHILSISRT